MTVVHPHPEILRRPAGVGAGFLQDDNRDESRIGNCLTVVSCNLMFELIYDIIEYWNVGV